MKRFALPALFVVVMGVAAGIVLGGHPAGATGPRSRFFPETNHTVSGQLLDYWETHGRLAQQGYPLSETRDEVSDTDGKHYMVQYFERAVFELHPENAGTPYEVLLSLLGSFEYQHRYGSAGAPNQHISSDNPRYFPQTRHSVGGKFLDYWEAHGALAQQGYPITGEFTETSALDGKPYRVQYFERADFELHPENAGTPYEVLLSQLGTFRYRAHVVGTATPILTAGPDIRLHATNVIGAPALAGNYVFYINSPPEGEGTPGPPTIDLYASDIGSRETWLVKRVAGNALYLAADRDTLAWVESDNTGSERIEGYRLYSRTEFQILPPAQRELGGLAVAGSMVYYQDGVLGHIGLYVLNMDTHDETLVSGHGRQPVASGGTLLWNEEQDFGTPGPGGTTGPAICTLHLRDGNSGDVTLDTVEGGLSGDCGFSGYSVSGNRVVWAPNPLAPDLSARLYTISTGATQVLPTGSAINPLINSSTLLWTRPPASGPQGWTIRSLNLDTNAQRTEVGPIEEMTQAWGILEIGAYAITITEPHSGRQEMYVLGLGSLPGP